MSIFRRIDLVSPASLKNDVFVRVGKFGWVFHNSLAYQSSNSAGGAELESSANDRGNIQTDHFPVNPPEFSNSDAIFRTSGTHHIKTLIPLTIDTLDSTIDARGNIQTLTTTEVSCL